MTTTHTAHPSDTIRRLAALLDQFPAGCDPEFDDGPEDLERQLPELRLQFGSDE